MSRIYPIHSIRAKQLTDVDKMTHVAVPGSQRLFAAYADFIPEFAAFCAAVHREPLCCLRVNRNVDDQIAGGGLVYDVDVENFGVIDSRCGESGCAVEQLLA